MSTSRETARDALVTLLTADLVGAGLPVKTVTGSKVQSLIGLTPLVAILSAGSSREALSFQGDVATFFLEVQVWVRMETGSWTNAMAEDALDQIEALIAGVYEAARGTSEWEIAKYADRTLVNELAVEGVLYFMERIPTEIKLATS